MREREKNSLNFDVEHERKKNIQCTGNEETKEIATATAGLGHPSRSQPPVNRIGIGKCIV